ncbi:flavin reductase family protein [Nocardia sp. XZ_19_231]|uniref:flavin reductase family protein n=1 Tax=Nocardia sp. XZ_19_231 TaxID=2769252 RepID=UPI00188FA525|nr:flavin reductase family protein [Nocardia sp. XZ_19_231]
MSNAAQLSAGGKAAGTPVPSSAPSEVGIHSRQFRTVLGHFPTSVVAITTLAEGGQPRGMVVGTFASVSMEPPLVSFLVDRSSSTLPTIRSSGTFCANALAGDQEPVSRRFATRGVDRFADLDWSAAPSGNPVLSGVVAWVDCGLEQVIEIGDHDLVIGRVRELRVESPKSPLLFFRGNYGDYLASAALLLDRLTGW